MKPIITFLTGFIFSMSLSFAQEYSFLTYNIRLDHHGDGENRWDLRKNGLASQIHFYEPDVFGIQEGLPHQVVFLDSVLAEYSFVGVGRDDGKNKGEFSALFYKKDKFRIVEQSTFWLSETPDKVSTGWDAALPRICTFALFEDLENRQRLMVFNTHFDHIGVEARNNSAKLIIKKINEINEGRAPVILMGDFNLTPEKEAIQFITSNLKDSKLTATKVVFGPEGTFNGFQFHEPPAQRIDYIFTDTESVEVLKYAVLTDSNDLKYYSDHLPVYIKVRMN